MPSKPMRRGIAITVAAVLLAVAGASCGSSSEIGSQGDLDSLVGRAAASTSSTEPDPGPIVPTPDGTGPGDPSAVVPGEPPTAGATGAANGAGPGSGDGSSGAGSGSGSGAGTGSGSGSSGADPGSSAAGSAAGGGVGAPGSGADDQFVIDTPDHPATIFCQTMNVVLQRAFRNGSDLQRAAQELLDDGDLITRFTTTAPDGGGEQVDKLIGAIHRLADGESELSALVTVPLEQFSDWARTVCPIVS